MPINALITSDAFTAILCAKSATEMVSGTITSCTIASVGALNACSASSSRCLFLPFGARQPVVIATAPRVFKPRLRLSFSFQSLLLPPPLPFLASLFSGFAPSLAAGLCSVPSFSFSVFALAAAASVNFFASSSARRCSNSCFLRKSSACIESSVAWRLASASRIAICSGVSTCFFSVVDFGSSLIND